MHACSCSCNPQPLTLQGARKHYCINRAVVRSGDIDAGCEELMKDGQGGCSYQKNANKLSHGDVQVRWLLLILQGCRVRGDSRCGRSCHAAAVAGS